MRCTAEKYFTQRDATPVVTQLTSVQFEYKL